MIGKKDLILLILIILGALIAIPSWLTRIFDESTLRFEKPKVTTQLSKPDIFFADTFDYTVRVTVDPREIKQDTVQVVFNPAPFEILKIRESRSQKGPGVLVITKTYTLRCLSCFPWVLAQGLIVPQKVRFFSLIRWQNKDQGTLENMPSPQTVLRIHSRLLLSDTNSPVSALRPRYPVPEPIQFAQGLTPFLFGAAVLALAFGGFSAIMAFRHSSKPSPPKIDPDIKAQQKLITLIQELKRGASVQKTLIEAGRLWQIFEPRLSLVKPEKAKQVSLRFEKYLYGPSKLNRKRLLKFLSDLAAFLEDLKTKEQAK